MKFSLTNEFKDRLREEILNYNIDFIHKSFEGVSYVDITELLYEFDSNDSKYILDNIDFDISAKIISELDEARFRISLDEPTAMNRSSRTANASALGMESSLVSTRAFTTT